jgi:hypothetical protein
MKAKAASLPPGVTSERCWCDRLAKVKQVEDFSNRSRWRISLIDRHGIFHVCEL